jgi:ABC-type sulfate transport system permease component
MRKQIINVLKDKIPSNLWINFWWFISVSAIILLPIGLVFTYFLGLSGFEGSERLTQILILFSVFYGLIVGIFILLLVDYADIQSNLISKIKWLARFAVVAPILTILTLFLIYSK